MDLALSLGEKSKAPLTFLDKIQPQKIRFEKVSLGFCMGLGEPHISRTGSRSKGEEEEEEEKSGSSDPPVQLDLLPVAPVQRNTIQPPPHMIPFPWLTANLLGEPGPSHKAAGREVEVNRGRSLAAEEGEDGGVQHSSPNSTVSSLIQNMDHRRGYNCKRESEMTSLLVVLNSHDQAVETGQRGHVSYSNSRARSTDDQDDEEEIINGLNRKKLRLSKEQSAFLEDSFKEHKTLNPKQKLALAKQLNLRPRQVEVWFQNRRARTKLKQTEVDCEYLKKWCETLTEENRRLQKEVQELRALKTSQPFYMQLPATTLTMCPSCERVASTATANATTANTTTTTTSVDAGTGTKSRSHPFTTSQTEAQAQNQTPIQQAGSLE